MTILLMALSGVGFFALGAGTIMALVDWDDRRCVSPEAQFVVSIGVICLAFGITLVVTV